MSVPYYPGITITTALGLSLIGMDEVVAENFIIIDSAIGGGNSSGGGGSTAWSTLTGNLSNGQVIPYADAGISRLGSASLAIGNGTAGNFSGTLSVGAMGIGTSTPSADGALLDVIDSITLSADNFGVFGINELTTVTSAGFQVGAYGCNINSHVTGTPGASTFIIGGLIRAFFDGTSTIPAVRGIISSTNNTSSGNVLDMIGGLFTANNYGGGTVNQGAGFRVGGFGNFLFFSGVDILDHTGLAPVGSTFGITIAGGKNAIQFASVSTMSSGPNTPEGALSAPVGSIYLRTNGGAGTSLYVKESGSGNTGWVGK